MLLFWDDITIVDSDGQEYAGAAARAWIDRMFPDWNVNLQPRSALVLLKGYPPQREAPSPGARRSLTKVYLTGEQALDFMFLEMKKLAAEAMEAVGPSLNATFKPAVMSHDRSARLRKQLGNSLAEPGAPPLFEIRVPVGERHATPIYKAPALLRFWVPSAFGGKPFTRVKLQIASKGSPLQYLGQDRDAKAPLEQGAEIAVPLKGGQQGWHYARVAEPGGTVTVIVEEIGFSGWEGRPEIPWNFYFWSYSSHIDKPVAFERHGTLHAEKIQDQDELDPFRRFDAFFAPATQAFAWENDAENGHKFKGEAARRDILTIKHRVKDACAFGLSPQQEATLQEPAGPSLEIVSDRGDRLVLRLLPAAPTRRLVLALTRRGEGAPVTLRVAQSDVAKLFNADPARLKPLTVREWYRFDAEAAGALFAGPGANERFTAQNKVDEEHLVEVKPERGNSDAADRTWEGHCHNMAPTTIVFEEPDAEIRSPNGPVKREELKLLAGEFYGNYRSTIAIEKWALGGTRGSRAHPAQTLMPFQANTPEKARRLAEAGRGTPDEDLLRSLHVTLGQYAAKLHAALQQNIGTKGVMLVTDMRSPDADPAAHAQIWNQALFYYRARYSEYRAAHFADLYGPTPNDDKPTDDEQVLDVVVDLELQANGDDYQRGRMDDEAVRLPARFAMAGEDPRFEFTGSGWSRAAIYRMAYTEAGSPIEDHQDNRWITCWRRNDKAVVEQCLAPRYFLEVQPLRKGNRNTDKALAGNPEVTWERMGALGLRLRPRYASSAIG